MNIFFTCKNTLVIVLQLYRLHVVYSENKKHKKKRNENFELTNISIISKGDMYRSKRSNKKREPSRPTHHDGRSKRRNTTESEKSNEDDYYSENETKTRHTRTKTNRKDTGYSTGSSLGSTRKHLNEKSKKPERVASKSRRSGEDNDEIQPKRPHRRDKQKLVRTDKHTKGHRKEEDIFSEESQSDLYTDNETKKNVTPLKRKVVKQQSRAVSTTDMSSE